jgi:hypothetical protein
MRTRELLRGIAYTAGEMADDNEAWCLYRYRGPYADGDSPGSVTGRELRALLRLARIGAVAEREARARRRGWQARVVAAVGKEDRR